MEKLVGIPGTINEEARHIKWMRRPDDPLTGARCYWAKVPDGFLAGMVSHDAVGKDGKLLWHVSVSHRDKHNQPDRVPNWDELKHAAYRLIQADVPLVLIFPRRSTESDGKYVDLYQTCLHLYEAEGDIDQ